MPGEFGIDARLDAIFRIGAAVEILREQRLAFRVCKEVEIQILKMLLAELAIAVPPDRFFGQRVKATSCYSPAIHSSARSYTSC